MNPFTNKAEYAVSTWTLEALELKEALRCIARYGFCSVELWADTVHFDPRAKIAPDDIKAWTRELGLHIHSAHAPFRHFFDRPRDDREFLRYRMNLWRETIDRCERLKVPILVMHALNREEYPYIMKEAGQVKEMLIELCQYAANRGITIALENIPDNVPASADDISCTLQQLKALFDIPKMGFCLDIGHVPLSRADPFEEIDVAGRRLITFHVHNNNGRIDSHDLPDRGILNWASVYQYAREKGYRGEFVLEILGGPDPEKKLAKVAALFEDQ